MTTEIEFSFLNILSQFVKTRRKELGISQIELALRAFGKKKMQSTISDIERGKMNNITTSTIELVLKALNADLSISKWEEDFEQGTFQYRQSDSVVISEKKYKRRVKEEVAVIDEEANSEFCLCQDPFFFPGQDNCMTCKKPLRT